MSQCEFYSFYEILYTINVHPPVDEHTMLQVFIVINVITSGMGVNWNYNLTVLDMRLITPFWTYVIVDVCSALEVAEHMRNMGLLYRPK